MEDEEEEEMAPKPEAKYVVAHTRRRDKRCTGLRRVLHRVEGCWRARRLAFQNFELLEVDPPPKEEFDAVCQDCWRHEQETTGEPGISEGSDSSSSSSSSS